MISVVKMQAQTIGDDISRAAVPSLGDVSPSYADLLARRRKIHARRDELRARREVVAQQTDKGDTASSRVAALVGDILSSAPVVSVELAR